MKIDIKGIIQGMILYFIISNLLRLIFGRNIIAETVIHFFRSLADVLS
jgi:hypothetical protein